MIGIISTMRAAELILRTREGWEMFDLNSLGNMEAAAALLSGRLPYHWNGILWCRP
jgi:hypothetical protein